MKILHTADWHLGDRLGRIDRTADLRRAVERIAACCEREEVDVLLMAGDLFSERCGGEGLRAAVEHLQRTFGPFLRRGGTVLALTGNHDHEGFCQTLRHAFALAAPTPTDNGDLVASGRLYLITNATFFRLKDRDQQEVQFVLMPYPTPSRYLDGSTRFTSVEERNRALLAAYVQRLELIQSHPAFRLELPSVLGAHIHLHSAVLSTPFRMSEAESVVVPQSVVPTGWAYVALGHVHQPQCLMGLSHVRYAGSIERLDLGERDDEKGCVLVDVGPDGLRGEPRWMPLECRPIYRVVISNPREDLPRLRAEHADAGEALVRYELTYTPGEDDLDTVLEEINALFPNWYDRDCRAVHEVGAGAVVDSPIAAQQGLYETVIQFLQSKLCDAPDRDAILVMAEAFLAEEESR